jgi:competence ComEA-like helix-hairpin-helix protein
MILTRLEKIAFVGLVALLGLGIFLLIGKIGLTKDKNAKILKQIANIAGLTDRTVLVKGDGILDEKENARKLNINRANQSSLIAIPKLGKTTAKRIYKFIQENGKIKDLKQLLNVKGMNRKKLRNLYRYVTVRGGHGGQAAWGDKLNLNFATVTEVNSLPGIGKKMAKKIIKFRDKNGGFFSLEDLKEVPGMTEKKMKKFIDKVEVR